MTPKRVLPAFVLLVALTNVSGAEEPLFQEALFVARLRAAAEAGDSNAQYHLGYSYEHGEGVLQDYDEAAKWYRKAAEAGDVDAQYSLATIYDIRKDIPHNAARWYRLAAGQGHAYAQYRLGTMYDRGEGVPRDYVEAYKWISLSVVRFHTAESLDAATKRLDAVRAKVNPASLVEAEKRAREWNAAFEQQEKSTAESAQPQSD